MIMDFAILPTQLPVHRYLLSATGLNVKDKVFNTRKEAEVAMHELCSKYNLQIECSEYDKHYRKYTNHNGVRFYINRI